MRGGKIDIVICKSISRFARNMLDSLTVIRRLKELGIEIWFEKEATRTLDSKGDVSHRKLIQFGKSDPPLKGLK
ncbi:MAG: recombinase family protein [Lachnospiraceae bacterium]|nr:recombinase family protein [Lachnospiraceae bacterium]